jgi:DNA-binding response OmpR family regulator
MQKSNDFLLNFEKKEVFFMSGNIFSANTLEMGVQQSQQQRLTMKQRQALELLFLSRPERVYTRAQIIDLTQNADKMVTDRAVDVQIVGLRRKLGGWAEHIETVRGVGYRFRP